MAITPIIERLAAGERIWAAECVMRLAGLALLAGAWFAALRLRALELRPPAHQCSPQEFLTALLAVLALWSGIALSWQGSKLLARQPQPPRPLT